MTFLDKIKVIWFVLTKTGYMTKKKKPTSGPDLSTYDWWKPPQNMSDLHEMISCYAEVLWETLDRPTDMDKTIWCHAEMVVFEYLNA
jgi:hypothetical protein